ncbi:MAG: hypothetical protein ACKVHD_03975, partial [Alphaproteobacteria bacterium]
MVFAELAQERLYTLAPNRKKILISINEINNNLMTAIFTSILEINNFTCNINFIVLKLLKLYSI